VGLAHTRDAARGARLDRKWAWRLGGRLDRHHLLIQRDLELKGVDHLAVILQRFGPPRLVIGRGQRNAADLEQLRGGEEHHVDRKSDDGIDQRALLEHHVIEPEMPGGNGGGQAGGSSPNNQHVTNGHIPTIVMACLGVALAEAGR
jgi:hypothetical protein